MTAVLRALGLVLGLVGATGVARADERTDGLQQAQLDRLRAEVAGEVQLVAYDLVDELVYGWIQDPVFSEPTSVVLAGVTVPVGLGTGLQALLENHITGLLTQNPSTQVQLVHCPSCTAVVIHSGPEGTVLSRGIDNPEVLGAFGESTGKHALYIDIEAEGAWLVLRARITRLTPDRPIVWSHTLATSASAPALLRQSTDLKSAEDARDEYLKALRGRGSLTVPLRFAVRTYARPEDDQGIGAPPFLWLQSGVELSATDARAWTSSLLVGYSVVPQAYQGLMAQARLQRLVTGRARSLTHPDLYAFVGAAVMTVWGPATAPFRERVLTADQLLVDTAQDDPRETFGAFQLGLDLRLGNRVGMSAFLETIPSLRDSPNIGVTTYLLGLPFQVLGAEVTFCF